MTPAPMTDEVTGGDAGAPRALAAGPLVLRPLESVFSRALAGRKDRLDCGKSLFDEFQNALAFQFQGLGEGF